MLWLIAFVLSDGDHHVAIIDRIAKVQVSQPEPENTYVQPVPIIKLKDPCKRQ